MPAYIEVHLKGNGRAFIDAGGISTVITGDSADIHAPGNRDKPVRVVLRVGETLDVIGDSAGSILTRCYMARDEARRRKAAAGDDFYIHYLEPLVPKDD